MTKATEAASPATATVPRNLTQAAKLLVSILDTQQITDCLGNGTAQNFAAMSVAIGECRDALAAIETAANEELESWASHHRECLTAIESLRLPSV